MAKVAGSSKPKIHLFRKSRRVLFGIRQKDIGRLIGRSALQVHRIEKGSAKPRPREAKLWAKLLKCSVGEIFPDLEGGGR